MITFKQFFSFRNNRFFWINLLLMGVVLAAAPLLTLEWLDQYTRHGQAVIVPDVKGMNLQQADQQLTAKTLKAVVVDSNFVKGVTPGSVLDQNPAGGFKVKEGRTIYLTINAQSAPRIAVPDIMDNSSLRQAEAKLRALGFKLTDPEWIAGEKDWVYSIKYQGRDLQAGEKVPHEAVLTLCVGDGNEEMTDSTLVKGDSLYLNNEQPIVDESWF
ncbi:PASTA domain containing protein [gut metagenome]|uniref:PASTA domain containing protein n=1 Tax=gut metagenome TaxID=749906 RepID=J9BV77_9ZZZZ